MGLLQYCDKIKLLKQKYVSLHQELKSFIPALKSRVHKFKDGSPGVGANNHDVKFRLAEIFLICDLDYLIRHRLANDNNSHSEIERIQTYVGAAICDGGSLEWEYKGEFAGLMEHEMLKITFEELERHELERMKFNAFKVFDELTSRLDGAPMLNRFMKSQTSLLKERRVFENFYNSNSS